jgi:hypothetical protein
VRSAGTFSSRRDAERAARRAEGKVEDGSWIDPTAGRITFRDYVENVWWPSRHLEVSTRAGYRSYLDKHFLPFFGQMAMAEILPSTIQSWVTQATNDGLSPCSREVPRHAAWSIQASSARPRHRVQPVHRHRAAEGDRQEGAKP